MRYWLAQNWKQETPLVDWVVAFDTSWVLHGVEYAGYGLPKMFIWETATKYANFLMNMYDVPIV